ncbi:uncharacterized protein F4812DRAFT_433012 [Daldinia caldariorum]|uniref:uncharacterized protein n=1 Tax=Daldinia caldariorum TaxID=326644 RepID=UPI002007E4CC|nr:uncharacterized protein F4812DRAFT_433012 [Daldinia caldariorum]KAI1466835.1 hypothetical protein F4812DRAFT_433012 [Daldinia caldariorum]
MNKLWGGSSRRDNSPRGSLDQDRDNAPSEHTRLLPNRVDSASYLSPDDPAVSPYNLWSVRIVRYLTILFTILTLAWWIILLVSVFATPPGFHTRGSGYFPFSYASLALSNLAFTLIFFAIPSKPVRVLSIILGILLLVDTILLMAIEKTRHEEGWVGMVSVLWAFLMALWTLLTDRLVEWGKVEEEERLTGRAETRRTLAEWTAVLVSTISMVILVIVALLITCTLILRGLDAGLAPPGGMFWVDGEKYMLHVYCHGNKTDSEGTKLPTVLLEGGESPVEHGLWQFAEDAVNNGSISRYCFVDRPGLAWSDTAPSPLSAGMAVEAVSEALVRAGEDGPWVLASAGIGSVYSRIFSARHGDQIKGLLFIDPLHEDDLASVGSPSRGFVLWIRGIISPLGLDRIPGALFKGRTKEDRVWGQSAHQTGKYLFAKLQENMVADTLSKRDLATSTVIQNPDTPLSLISSGEKIRRDSGWEDKQRDLSHVTDNLKHWDIVNKAPHRVWDTREGRVVIEKRLKGLVYSA